MRQRLMLAALGCCLLISGQARAAGESYQLMFKDPQDAKRCYQVELTAHVDAAYQGINVPAPTTTDVHITGKALETVLDNKNGIADLSLAISGRKAGVTSNAGANAMIWPSGFKSGDWPDYAMSYQRSPNGLISAMTCTNGKLPNDALSSPMAQLAADILNADSLALTFPFTPLKPGGHWTEKVNVSLGSLQLVAPASTPAAAGTAAATGAAAPPALAGTAGAANTNGTANTAGTANAAGAAATPSPTRSTPLTADIVKHYTLQGWQMVDGKYYLVIICTFDSGNKSLQQTLANADGSATKVTLRVRVKEQSTYLFDQQSGEIYRVTTTGNAQYRTTTAQPGNPITFTMNRSGSSTISRVAN